MAPPPKNPEATQPRTDRSRGTNNKLRRKSAPTNRNSTTDEIRQIVSTNLNKTHSKLVLDHLNNLETQLIHSQRMESLGLLASGIAHDFNNLLGGIMGYTSLLKSKLEEGSDNHQLAQTIEIATQRGAEITQQLLDASRKEPFRPKSININEIIEEVENILYHTLPKEIEIKTNLHKDLPTIKGSYAQMHQVLMNLCINAADAMPQGGTIRLTTRKQEQQVRIRVSDSGHGMPASVKERIFEPFFTTKKPGEGTGLGLSVVNTIINNHQGSIEVQSGAGQGTTFDIYLPVDSR